MNLRLEQCLREGGWPILMSVWILPIWLTGAAAHRSHWATFVMDLGWSAFLLGWGGVVWSVLVSVMLILWSAFAFMEDEGKVGTLWARCIAGVLIVVGCALLSAPGWVWLSQLSGASASTTMFASLKSLFVPVCAVIATSLKVQLMPASIASISAILLSALLTGYVWSDLWQ